MLDRFAPLTKRGPAGCVFDFSDCLLSAPPLVRMLGAVRIWIPALGMRRYPAFALVHAAAATVVILAIALPLPTRLRSAVCQVSDAYPSTLLMTPVQLWFCRTLDRRA